jgi:hypothetical protein
LDDVPLGLLVKRNLFRLLFLGFGFLLIAFWLMARNAAGQAESAADWRPEWAVGEGLALARDTAGYNLPTAIAFVPQPGAGPNDPLYFVTELRGTVKVVTNDRTVYTFAEGLISSRPAQELPNIEGETGLAGICLAPETGYVFVTFAYQDENGLLRNNIIRFTTTPQTFGLAAAEQLAFTDLFAGYEAAISHQIGGCQVVGDALYVSVADGWQTAESQQIDSLLGKVLRLSLDGQPLPDNPFYAAEDEQTAADFVWAYGFRNPFGLAATGEQLYTADNGSDVDRLVAVEAGENYLWNGSDWSIGARADVALSPDVGPAQLAYDPGGSAGLPDGYGQSFYLATSRPEVAGVLRVGFDVAAGQATGTPEYVVRYGGDGIQIVSGVAVGPDGLYFVPTLPDAAGENAVYQVSDNPNNPHPFSLVDLADPLAMMEEKGCFGCHQLDERAGTIGPSLAQGPLVARLETRLNSAAYTESVAEIDRLAEEPYIGYAEARAAVLQAEGEEKLRLWVMYHIMEPKFDNPYSQMPNLGLTEAEAGLITDFLLREQGWLERGREAILAVLPVAPLPRHLLMAFAFGLAAGGSLGIVLPRFVGPIMRRKRLE